MPGKQEQSSERKLGLSMLPQIQMVRFLATSLLERMDSRTTIFKALNGILHYGHRTYRRSNNSQPFQMEIFATFLEWSASHEIASEEIVLFHS
jgi:hypothetical protein